MNQKSLLKHTKDLFCPPTCFQAHLKIGHYQHYREVQLYLFLWKRKKKKKMPSLCGGPEGKHLVTFTSEVLVVAFNRASWVHYAWGRVGWQTSHHIRHFRRRMTSPPVWHHVRTTYRTSLRVSVWQSQLIAAKTRELALPPHGSKLLSSSYNVWNFACFSSPKFAGVSSGFSDFHSLSKNTTVDGLAKLKIASRCGWACKSVYAMDWRPIRGAQCSWDRLQTPTWPWPWKATEDVLNEGTKK